MKKTLSLVLACLMLLPLLASCGNARSLTIIKKGACTVLYDPQTVSNGTLGALTAALEETTGVTVTPIDEGEVTKGCIVVGNVTVDNVAVSDHLRNQDFYVGIHDNYYLLGGSNDKMTAEAVSYFVENVLPNAKSDGQKLRVLAKDNYTQNGTYRLENVTVCGEPLYKCSILTPDSPSVSEWRTAVLLRETLSTVTGYTLPLTTESEASKAARDVQIRVGKSLLAQGAAPLPSAHAYAITADDRAMYVAADSFLGYEAAQASLSGQLYSAKNTDPKVDSGFSLTGDGAENATAPLTANGDVRVMFSNIHGHDSTENGRTPVKEASQQLSELFLTYLPDVLGTQEFSPSSYTAGLNKMIAAEYEEVIVSTGGNYKTYTALFYRKSTMELLKCGYLGYDSLTYNEYPELLGAGSASQVKHVNTRKDGTTTTQNGRQDASKGVTWGIFRVKATGKIIMVGSTHLWWESNENLDEIARKVQLSAMSDHLTQNATAFATEKGLSTPIPIFVGGDYNTSLNRANTALTTLENRTNSFRNANSLATSKLTISTHHGYATFNEELGIYEDPLYTKGTARDAIDHIYVNTPCTGAVKVNQVGILTDLYAHLSSDHNPIYADITLTDSVPKLA